MTFTRELEGSSRTREGVGVLAKEKAMIHSRLIKWVAVAALSVATVPVLAATVVHKHNQKTATTSSKTTPAKTSSKLSARSSPVAPSSAKARPASVRLGHTTTTRHHALPARSTRSLKTTKSSAHKLTTTKHPAISHKTNARLTKPAALKTSTRLTKPTALKTNHTSAKPLAHKSTTKAPLKSNKPATTGKTGMMPFVY